MGDNNITININSGTIVKAILFVLLFWAIYIFRDLVLVILTSIVIASAIEPAVKWLKNNRIPRLPSVILIYLLLAIIVAGLFYFFIPPLFREISALVAGLPQFVENLDFLGSVTNRDFGVLSPAVEDISRNVSISDFVNQLQSFVGDVTGGFWKTVSAVSGGALSFVLIVVLSFYLSVQENGIDNFLRVVTPIKHQEYIINLWKRSQNKIGLWMQGQLVLALIIGTLVYLGLAILDIRYAFLLAVLAGFFELIPLFGPVLAAIPAIAIGFSQGGPTTGLIILGLYLIIQQFENHLIFPLVVKKVTGLPAIFVIISLIIGAKLAGFLGVLLSVPIATAVMEFVSDVDKGHRKALENQVIKESK